MNLKLIKPKKSLNKAYLKVKPHRSDIERFKGHLIALLNRINEEESEEFHKNLIIDFLNSTYYKPNYFINTKGRNDLVVHNGKSAKSSVGVIIETKRPSNKGEMITEDNLNKKAFHELILYYLRERITHKNIEIKHLIITNINEWFIFNATTFDRLFAQNKSFVKQFTDFENNRLADTKTEFFYNEITAPYIDTLTSEIECTHFNFQSYQKPLQNQDKKDDHKLISLFKILSPEHLLKLPFANDSNSLDKQFYSELLHIIGLTEIKKGGKKLIERNKESERNTGSLLEDTIIQLDSLDKIYQLKNSSQFGSTHAEKLFNVALTLSITWINRILFLKLLEAQLLTYHKGDSSYSFLNLQKIKNYDDLNSLFFQVLAKKHSERNSDVKKIFEKVPYLNSSLFEPTSIEHEALFISNLKDEKTIPIISSTVLKNEQGKKRTGKISTLQYLFEFLDAYDFSSEGSEGIQEENKTLINASVLGLIFEKINGYKDGSFFTPGFITMYMCRETIRKAVVQKFNETKNWTCETLDDVYDKIEDREEANTLINDIKICDPAVGSGHFLVSALNEMIAVKNDLNILQDRAGRRLKEYHVEVVNDELVITDEDGELFEYNPHSKESQRVQETLFHEKQTIIENCLFGVDINPNSVKICRLRLWIELLKNAYYTQNSSLEGEEWPKTGGLKINNLPHLKTFRKELRNNLTPAEASLWTLLKGKQMEGRKFRRQHSVGNYILDFYCPSERIAIELDGQGHFETSQAEYDRERDLFLETFGIRVLRFENMVVWDNPKGLLDEVRSYFGKQPPRPSATPPFQGGESNQGQDNTSLSRGWHNRGMELQTLPNIDINIKSGNSLVSRFELDTNIKNALKKSKWTIDGYRTAVSSYRNAKNKDEKRGMERLIKDIKSDFRSEVSKNDPKAKRLYKLNGELFNMTQQQSLFGMSKREKSAWNKKVEKLTKDAKKLEAEIEEIKNNKIFENAFEWRFEFPEVLNDDGDFVGFDVVIGNPPYMRVQEIQKTQPLEKEYYEDLYENAKSAYDLANIFFELAINISSEKSRNSFIFPHKFFNSASAQVFRDYLTKGKYIDEIAHFGANMIFDDADTYTCVTQFSKEPKGGFYFQRFPFRSDFKKLMLIKENYTFITYEMIKTASDLYGRNQWVLFDDTISFAVFNKIYTNSMLLNDVLEGIFQGIATSKDQLYILEKKHNKFRVPLSGKEYILEPDLFKPFLMGKDVQRYSFLKTDKYVFFPYKIINENAEIVTLEEIKTDFPLTYRYVMDHEKDFKARESGRAGKMKHWHTYIYPKNLNRFEQPKLSSMEICANYPNVTLNENSLYHTTKVYSWIKKESLELSNEYLLAIANSKVLWWFLKLTGDTLQGDARTFKTNYLNPFPIPESVSKEKEDEIIFLVDQVADLKKESPSSNTSSLEAEIDKLVYELYGLTEEEIAIVESA